jgi:uncharacterized protein
MAALAMAPVFHKVPPMPHDRPRIAVPKIAELVARRLLRGLQADAVYLFGSYARAEAGPDSDLDLLVVVPDSAVSRYQRGIEARRLVGDIAVPKDIVVMTRKEWESERGVVCSLASTVAREGVQLHG